MAPDRKQLAEAGRKKLEEFRRAKAVKSPAASPDPKGDAPEAVRLESASPGPTPVPYVPDPSPSNGHYSAAPVAQLPTHATSPATSPAMAYSAYTQPTPPPPIPANTQPYTTTANGSSTTAATLYGSGIAAADTAQSTNSTVAPPLSAENSGTFVVASGSIPFLWGSSKPPPPPPVAAAAVTYPPSSALPTYSSVAAPEPWQPQSAAPEPWKPQGAAPEPWKPDSTGAQPWQPQSAAPEPWKPTSTVPEPWQPRSTVPEPTSMPSLGGAWLPTTQDTQQPASPATPPTDTNTWSFANPTSTLFGSAAANGSGGGADTDFFGSPGGVKQPGAAASPVPVAAPVPVPWTNSPPEPWTSSSSNGHHAAGGGAQAAWDSAQQHAAVEPPAAALVPKHEPAQSPEPVAVQLSEPVPAQPFTNNMPSTQSKGEPTAVATASWGAAFGSGTATSGSAAAWGTTSQPAPTQAEVAPETAAAPVAAVSSAAAGVDAAAAAAAATAAPVQAAEAAADSGPPVAAPAAPPTAAPPTAAPAGPPTGPPASSWWSSNKAVPFTNPAPTPPAPIPPTQPIWAGLGGQPKQAGKSVWDKAAVAEPSEEAKAALQQQPSGDGKQPVDDLAAALGHTTLDAAPAAAQVAAVVGSSSGWQQAQQPAAAPAPTPAAAVNAYAALSDQYLSPAPVASATANAYAALSDQYLSPAPTPPPATQPPSTDADAWRPTPVQADIGAGPAETEVHPAAPTPPPAHVQPAGATHSGSSGGSGGDQGVAVQRAPTALVGGYGGYQAGGVGSTHVDGGWQGGAAVSKASSSAASSGQFSESQYNPPGREPYSAAASYNAAGYEHYNPAATPGYEQYNPTASTSAVGYEQYNPGGYGQYSGGTGYEPYVPPQQDVPSTWPTAAPWTPPPPPAVPTTHIDLTLAAPPPRTATPHPEPSPMPTSTHQPNAWTPASMQQPLQNITTTTTGKDSGASQSGAAGGGGAGGDKDGSVSLADAFASFIKDGDDGIKPHASHESHGGQQTPSTLGGKRSGGGGGGSRFAWLFGTPKARSGGGGDGGTTPTVGQTATSAEQAVDSTAAGQQAVGSGQAHAGAAQPLQQQPAAWGSQPPAATAWGGQQPAASAWGSQQPAATALTPDQGPAWSPYGNGNAAPTTSATSASSNAAATTATTMGSSSVPSFLSAYPAPTTSSTSSYLTAPAPPSYPAPTTATTSTYGAASVAPSTTNTSSWQAPAEPAAPLPAPQSTGLPAQPPTTALPSMQDPPKQDPPPKTAWITTAHGVVQQEPARAAFGSTTQPPMLHDSPPKGTWTHPTTTMASPAPQPTPPAPPAPTVNPTITLSAPYSLSSYSAPSGAHHGTTDTSFLNSYLDNLLRPPEVPVQAGHGGDHGADQGGAADAADGAAGGDHATGGDGGDPWHHRAGSDMDGYGSGTRAPSHVSFESDSQAVGPVGYGARSKGHHTPGRPPLHPSAQHEQQHGMPRVASQGQFSVLQQHIDDLTAERVELQRGLTAATRAHAALGEENGTLVDRINAQAKTIDALNKKLERYELELNAQVLSVEGMAAEREAARVAQAEAVQRATALAGEVVGLEASFLNAKSGSLKLQRDVEQLQAQVSKLDKQLTASRREHTSANEDVGRLTLEKRALFVRLKQAESRLNKMLDESGMSHRAREALMSGLSPVRAETAEEGSQCSLLEPSQITALQAELDLAIAAAAAARADAAAAREATRDAEERLRSMAAQLEAAQKEQLDRRQSGGAAADSSTTRAGPAGSAAGSPGGAARVASGWAGGAGLIRVRDPPSAAVAQRALASLPPAVVKAVESARGVPDALLGPLAQLGRWLPVGPLTTASPAGMIAEEHLRAANQIHDLLNRFEDEYGAAVEEVEELTVENASLRAANDDLRRGLEMATQRLELSLSQGAGMAAALHAAGQQHPTDSPGGSVGSPADPYSTHTVYPGRNNHHNGAAASGSGHAPDPASPPPRQAPGPAGGYTSGYGGAGAAVGRSADGPAGMGGAGGGKGPQGPQQAWGGAGDAGMEDGVQGRPRGSSWLGFLFSRQARPKKRIRNALL